MKRNFAIQHEFVQFVPEDRREHTLYISVDYATAVHNCFCGCGTKVVTPIHPTGWQLMFDGDTVSLHPSVGNWTLPCRSHYIVRRNMVVWAGDMTKEEIDRGRARDSDAREAYFGTQVPKAKTATQPAKKSRKKKLWRWWSDD